MRGVAGGGGQGNSALAVNSGVSHSLKKATVRGWKAVGLIWGVVVSVAVLITGCDPLGQGNSVPSYFTAEADSMADLGADLGDKTYVIASAMQDTSEEDLAFKQIANWVRNALKLKGYRQVSRKEDASLLVRLAYGKGQPQTRTSTYTHAPGYSYRVGYYWYSIPPATSTTTMTTFDARLLLEAYDLKTPGKLPQVWKTTLTASNMDVVAWSRLEPRSEFANMLGAALDCLGTNSGYKKVYLQNGAVGQAVVNSLCVREAVAEPLIPTGADINAKESDGARWIADPQSGLTISLSADGKKVTAATKDGKICWTNEGFEAPQSTILMAYPGHVKVMPSGMLFDAYTGRQIRAGGVSP